MTSEFDVVGSTVKVSGEAPMPKGHPDLEHGDEVYVVSRATVKEVSFPEDKDGNVLRVHKAKLSQAFVVNGDDAEKLIAAERERISGQGNLIAEIARREEEDADDDEISLV